MTSNVNYLNRKSYYKCVLKCICHITFSHSRKLSE